MAESRLSRFGVGPVIAVPTAAYTAIALAAGHWRPNIFLFSALPAARAVGAILVALGGVLWIAGGIAVMLAYNRDELVTSGAFAVVRHPIYAAWISLILPGLALWLASWPMLLAPLIAWALFKRLIHREDEYLEKRFGQAYLNYRYRVNEVIPIPRLARKGR